MLPLVVQIEKTEQHTADTVAFNRSPVRLGRSPLNDLPLEEGFVSQWHAVVRFNAERTTVLDLGSTNRTTINGERIERNVEVPVDHTSDVRIGSLRLHFLRVPAPPELFGQRRRSAFARIGDPEQGDAMRTMFFGDQMPSEAPMAAASNLSGALSGAWGPKPMPTAYGKSAYPSSSASEEPRTAIAGGHSMGAGRAGATGALDAGYHAYRNGWGAFFSAVRARLQSMPADEREAEVLALQRTYPQLALEPDFRAYLKEISIDPLKTGTPEMEDWLRRLTDGLFPLPGGSVNIALAMERVGELLEVFTQAFVGTRRVHEQFCREMSLARYEEPTTLQTSDDTGVVLAYLLTPTQEGKDRVTELSRALAEGALHQVALISSVIEGARSMLDSLSPKVITRAPDPPAHAAVLSDDSVMNTIWPHAARKLWRRFNAAHYDLAENDRFTRELFGRSFARRYYSVTGGEGDA